MSLFYSKTNMSCNVPIFTLLIVYLLKKKVFYELRLLYIFIFCIPNVYFRCRVSLLNEKA